MPENKNRKRYTKPAEDSYEAFRAMVMGIAKQMGIPPKDNDEEVIKKAWERRQAKKNKGG